MSKNSVFALVSQFLGQQNNISVPVPLVRIVGDYTAAALVSQVVYWSDRTTDPEGWFWKTHEQWHEELYLTSDQIRRCVKSANGLIEVKRAGVPAKNFYRINRELLVERLEELAEGAIVTTSRNGETQHLEIGKPNDSALGNPTTSRTANPTSNTKTTSKTTPKTSTKSGGEYNVIDNRHQDAQPHASSVAQPSPTQPTTSGNASLQNSRDEGEAEFTAAALPLPHLPSPPTAVLEGPAPDGVTADAVVEDLSLTDEEVEFIFGTGNADETKALEEVAGGGAGAETAQEGPSEDETESHAPEETRLVLVKALGGNAKLNSFMEETPPGLRGKSRRAWITEIRPHRALELVNQGRIEANAANPWTFIIRLLDVEIGSTIGRSGTASATPSTVVMNASSLAPAKHAEPSDHSEDQGKLDTGARWRCKASGEIMTITGTAQVKNGRDMGLRYVLDDRVQVKSLDLVLKYEFLPAEASA